MTTTTLLGAAFGIANPAMQNVALDLAPDRISAVSGLRAMFGSLGGAVSVPIVTTVAGSASSVEHGLSIAFIGMAGFFALAALLVYGVPEMQRTPRRRPAAR